MLSVNALALFFITGEDLYLHTVAKYFPRVIVLRMLCALYKNLCCGMTNNCIGQHQTKSG